MCCIDVLCLDVFYGVVCLDALMCEHVHGIERTIGDAQGDCKTLL